MRRDCKEKSLDTVINTNKNGWPLESASSLCCILECLLHFRFNLVKEAFNEWDLPQKSSEEDCDIGPKELFHSPNISCISSIQNSENGRTKRNRYIERFFLPSHRDFGDNVAKF